MKKITFMTIELGNVSVDKAKDRGSVERQRDNGYNSPAPLYVVLKLSESHITPYLYCDQAPYCGEYLDTLSVYITINAQCVHFGILYDELW